MIVGQLRSMLVGVPDETEVAVQEANDPSLAFFLDGGNVAMWGSTLVLQHNGDGVVLSYEDGVEDG